MKGLAAFVMRGRFPALLVVVAGAGSLLFSWVSAAVVALVTLRKGAGQGAWLFFWALLPSGTLLYVYGDSGPLALLVGTMALALVLRSTVSLSLTVLASVAVGVVAGLALALFAGEFLQQLVVYFGDFLAKLEQQLSQGGEKLELPRPEARQIAGMLGAGTAMTSVLCLLLARYWQSALYNPGGFGEEFKALRYPVATTLMMVVPALALSGLGAQYRTWAMIFFIPLTFAGLALVHARAEARGQGTGWLSVFYAVWLVFDPVKLLVVFFAIADSWINFRQRWPKPATAEPGSQDRPDNKDDTDI